MHLRNKTIQLSFAYCVALLLITLISYSNYTSHTFLHWDDINYVLRTEFLRPFTIDNIFRMFSDFNSSNWHPVTWLSYSLDFLFWGEDAPAFILTNIIIHFLNSLLVFYLAYLLLSTIKTPHVNNLTLSHSTNNQQEFLAAMAAGLLFAIHPQHVESVAWISGRKDLLCAFFYFATIIAYLHQHYADNKTFWKHTALLSFTLALMAKSMAITLPIVLVILDIYPLKIIKRGESILDSLKQLIDGKLIYLLISGAVLTITFITQTSNITGVQEYALSARIENSSTNFFYYIFSIFSPNILSPYHPLQSTASETTWVNWIPVLLSVALSVVCYIGYRKNYKFPFLLLASYLILLLPVIGLLHLGHAVRADRYAYISTAGFYIFLGFVTVFAGKKLIRSHWQSALFLLTFLAVTLSLSFTTYQHSKAWMNDRTVWQKVINQYPDSAATAYVNLGNVLFEERQFLTAIDNYKEAIRVDPQHLEAMRNLGLVYENLNDHENAEKYYNLMVQVRPDIHYPYTVVGDYYFNNKKYQQAASYYQKALKISPSSENALYKNGLIDLLNGDLKKAEQKIDYLLQLRPNDLEGLQVKAQIKLAQKDYKTAGELANAILLINPADAVATHVIRQINRTSEHHSKPL
ncbi:tetratricopeptide repeat protein [Kaarinaea lacus]